MPFVTIAIVLVNVIVYLLEIRHGGSFLGGPASEVSVRYGAIPLELTHAGTHCELLEQHTLQGVAQAVTCTGQPGYSGRAASPLAAWQTVFTSMFMHGSFLHIFGNMIFLAIFGPNVEDAMSRLRYVLFYLLGGAIALAAQVLVSPHSTVPTIGASGAIAAVLGGYIVLYPRARVLSLVFIVFFFTIIEVPAAVLLGVWFLEQLWFGLGGLATPIGGGEGVAYFAHVGGFVFGLLAIRLFARRVRRPPPAPVY